MKKIMAFSKKSCIDKHGRTTDNINTWSAKDIILLLCAHRIKNNKAILAKKKEVVDLCNAWKHRKLATYNGRVDADLTMLDNEDALTATALQEVKVPVPSIAIVEHMVLV